MRSHFFLAIDHPFISKEVWNGMKWISNGIIERKSLSREVYIKVQNKKFCYQA